MSEKKNCSGNCETCQSGDKTDCLIGQSLEKIGRKLVVISGKGGVGKSTAAVNIAAALARAGKRTGLLDLDFHGPSIPKMLNIECARPESADGRLIPVEAEGVGVMSIGFLLEHPDDPVIWRGPMKIGVIRQMFTDVNWGDLDWLVVDCPPGTGDEPLTICQLLAESDGAAAVIVTTPQQVAAADVAKSLNFCRQLDFPVAGVIENMSGFVCPKCGEWTGIFASGGGEKLANDYGVEFLGRVPIDPAICCSGDAGEPFVLDEKKASAQEFRRIVDKIVVR